MIGKSPLAVVIAALALALGGCENKGKLSAERAPKALEHVPPLIERDLKQVREGLPKGVETMGKLVDDDPGNDPEGLRHIIEKTRAGTTELAVAKSTFFVFVSPEGTVLRGEADPDLAAGQSLFKEVPEAKRIFEKDGVQEVFGFMQGLRGVQKGGDLEWIAGQKVKSKSGKVVGAFVTGWSLRRYVEYLENDLRRWLTDQQADKKRPPPLSYLFLVHGDKAYGAPVTPDVDAEAVGKLELSKKVGDGIYATSLDVEGHHFAVVAKKLPGYDPDVVLVLMFSVV
jgi:hypothetical protein